MADATLTLDAEINTSDWNAGVKDIESGSRQIEESARQADEALGDVDKSASKSSSGFGKFGAAAGAVGGLVSSGIGMAVDAIADLTGDIVEASDSADKFRSTLNFAGLDTGTIDALTASTQEYADQTVYSISDIRNVTAQLAANGVADFDKLAEAAGNLNAVAGGNADTFGSVGMVLTQTAGAGKLTTENWNQLADAIPGASGKLQEAMLKNGAYTGNFREAMEKGEISAEEFNKAILDLGMTDVAQEAATSTATIEGAMGNLQASVVGVGTTILDQFKGPLTSGISFAAQSISGLSGVFTGLVQTVGPILSQIGSIFAQTFSAFPDTINMVLLPALQGVGTALQNLGSAVLPVIMAAMQTIAPIIATIASQVMNVALQIAGFLTPIINNVAQIIQTVLPAIQVLFQQYGMMIMNNIQAAFSFIQTVIESVMNVIGSIISTILALVQGDWDGVWNGIKDIASNVWDGIGNVISAGVDLMGNLVQNALNFVKGIFESIWGAIGGTVSSWWSNITSSVSSGVNSMMSFITGIPGKIQSAFANAGSWLVSAGRNIIQGLINGITNAIGGAISAVKNAVSGIIDGAKSLLGIASPSKVFDREIGRMIPAGLGQGVRDNTKAAVQPVQQMVDDLLPSSIVAPTRMVSSPVSMNANGGPRVSAPITVNALDPNAAAQETVRVINFHYV